MIAATGQPLYLQVADDIRAQIAGGELAVGDPIPSTAKLAKHHEVSIGVIQAAVKVLKDEGVLVGQSGKAVFVRAAPEAAAVETSALKSVDEQIAELREEIRQLAEQQPAEVLAKLEELRTDVGRLQADLRALYDRIGQPYPHDESTEKPRRRKSGA